MISSRIKIHPVILSYITTCFKTTTVEQTDSGGDNQDSDQDEESTDDDIEYDYFSIIYSSVYFA